MPSEGGRGVANCVLVLSMGDCFDDCMDGFEDKCESICDIYEVCEVCGGFLYDAIGRNLKRDHIECRRILAMERGCGC